MNKENLPDGVLIIVAMLESLILIVLGVLLVPLWGFGVGVLVSGLGTLLLGILIAWLLS